MKILSFSDHSISQNVCLTFSQVPMETTFFHSPCSRHCSKINLVTSPYVMNFPAPGTHCPSELEWAFLKKGREQHG